MGAGGATGEKRRALQVLDLRDLIYREERNISMKVYHNLACIRGAGAGGATREKRRALQLVYIRGFNT